MSKSDQPGIAAAERRPTITARELLQKLQALALRVSLSIAVAASLMAAGGCIVPFRVKDQTKNVNGTPEQLDIGFLRTGSTKREEVEKNLGGIRVGGNQNFFWGRWEHSKWAVFAMGLGGYAGRMWGVSNLVIQFDQTGLVKNWDIVDDKKLGGKLDEVDSGETDSPLDLSTPMPLAARVCCWVGSPPSMLVLSLESFHYLGPDYHQDRCDLEIARTNVQNFQLGPIFGSGYWPGLVATTNFVEPVVGHCVFNGHRKSSKKKRLEIISIRRHSCDSEPT